MGTNDDNLLNQVHVAVIRLDTKMDGLVTDLHRLREDQKGGHEDHEKRLRFLEGDHVTVGKFSALEERPYVSPASVRWLVGTLIGVAGLIIALINIVK